MKKPTMREIVIGLAAILGTFFGFQLIPDESPEPEIVVDTVVVTDTVVATPDTMP